MNAKIAAAISLGASSLALIGSISIANAANAADATTTDTSHNPTAHVKTISDTGFNAVSNVTVQKILNHKPLTRLLLATLLPASKRKKILERFKVQAHLRITLQQMQKYSKKSKNQRIYKKKLRISIMKQIKL